jgi:CRISPR-associated protein Cas2
MYAWVIYDIRKNKTRTRIAKRCKFYGLVRVQKSVFVGRLKGKWVLLLFAELSNLINQRTDRLFVVPMNNGSFKAIKESGTLSPLTQIANPVKVKIV